MKKFLLIAASAWLAFGADAQVISQPQIVSNAVLTAMSPNGKFGAGTNPYYEGFVDFVNFETGESYLIGGEDEMDFYDLGMGANSISNDGIMVLSTTYAGTAAYVEDGELKFLPVPEDVSSAFANAITPDGSRIAGMIGLEMTLEDMNVPMQRPVIWNRQADGTYSDPVELPYPAKDITGRTPQYILIDGISEDGKTLIGQVIDNSGWLSAAPVLFTEGEDGWTYKILAEKYLNPLGIEIPEGESMEEPSPKDFLTGDDLAAYEEALALAETLVEPEATDFMTEEEKDAYLQALMETGYAYYAQFMTEEEYDAYIAASDYYWAHAYPNAENFLSGENLEAYNEAVEKYESFMDLLNSIALSQEVNFQMNAITMSLNGKYVGVAGDMVEWVTIDDPWLGEYEEPMMLTKGYIFNVETGECSVKECDGYSAFIPTYIANDGRILCAQPFSFFTGTMPMAFFADSFESPIRPLHEVVAETNPELYRWMEENMHHQMVTYEWDDELEDEVEVVVDMWITGAPCSNADMSVVSTWALNVWDMDSEDFMYTYVMPMGDATVTAIEEVESEQKDEIRHNLAGQRVDKNYKGFVVKGNKLNYIK